MIAAEATATFRSAPSRYSAVSTEDQFQTTIDSPLEGIEERSWFPLSHASMIWRDFVSPYRLTASDWIEDVFIYSPEDEPRLADRWNVFLSEFNRTRNDDFEHVLDWDYTIEPEPSRPERTIQVTLQFAGRDAPIPEEDPWAT